MEEHLSRVKILCRVCGKNPKSYMHRKISDKVKPLLLSAFGVDVSNEPAEIYPSLVCNHCYLSLSMQRIAKSKETGVVSKSQLALSSWLPHSDTEYCSVCHGDVSEKQKKSGSVGRGRPLNTDISHLSRTIL